MTKKRLISLFFSFTTLTCVAQQRPHYTQYVLNNFILNPALTGIENYTDVKLSGRSQWVGLDGAPQTFYLTAHRAIGKKDYKTSASSFSIPGANPRGSSYWENYTASEPHHGVGLVLVSDKTGNFSRVDADVSYAYHLGLTATTNLALGVAAGFSRWQFDRSQAEPTDPNDPALGNGNVYSKIQPDLNIGVWLYSRDYFLGISGQQILPVRFSFTNAPAALQRVPHLFATAGYRFLLTEDVNALPSLMVKYVNGTPTTPQFDFNLKLQYRDLLWLGGSYRFQDGVAAMLGFNVANTFNLGYAYDFTQTELNTASRGTHELIIGFLLGNRYGDTCPRNVW
ncbi:MAG: type IX secretion system membrane protein PorP/SprF [Flavisolibacter sp.]